ncbi:MAG: DUF3899 domain-containing protein [Ruminococcaceae bacterium]|nr:DUF3899 domain-containing protein [Oscillospiraceae bacterium]
MKQSRKIFICIAATLISVIILMATLGFFKTHEIHSRIKILADATAIPALFSLGLFGLISIGKSGMFDIFGYGVSRLSSLFIPKRQIAHTSYYDYKTKTHTKNPSFALLLYIGIPLLICSILLTILYYKV